MFDLPTDPNLICGTWLKGEKAAAVQKRKLAERGLVGSRRDAKADSSDSQDLLKLLERGSSDFANDI